MNLTKKSIISKVGEHKILCAVSGGVDSTVVAKLLCESVGAENCRFIFVNNGLLRKDEYETVLKNYEDEGIPVEGVDATETFLT